MKFYFYNTVTIKDSAAYIESSVCFFVLSYIIFCFLLAFSVIISTFIFSEYKSILRILIVPLCILYLALYYHGLLKKQRLRNRILYVDSKVIHYHSPYATVSFSTADIISIKDTSYFHNSVYQTYRRWNNQLEITIKNNTEYTHQMTADLTTHFKLHIENNHLILTIPDLHIEHTQYLRLFAFIENIVQ